MSACDELAKDITDHVPVQTISNSITSTRSSADGNDKDDNSEQQSNESESVADSTPDTHIKIFAQNAAQGAKQTQLLRQRNINNARLVIMGRHCGLKRPYKPRQLLANDDEWEQERLRESMLLNWIARLNALNPKLKSPSAIMEKNEIVRAVRDEFPKLAQEIPCVQSASRTPDSRSSPIAKESSTAELAIKPTQHMISGSPKNVAAIPAVAAAKVPLPGYKTGMPAEAVAPHLSAVTAGVPDDRERTSIMVPGKANLNLTAVESQTKAAVTSQNNAVKHQATDKEVQKVYIEQPKATASSGHKRKSSDIDEVDLDLQLEEVRLRAELQTVMIRRQKHQAQWRKMGH